MGLFLRELRTEACDQLRLRLIRTHNVCRKNISRFTFRIRSLNRPFGKISSKSVRASGLCLPGCRPTASLQLQTLLRRDSRGIFPSLKAPTWIRERNGEKAMRTNTDTKLTHHSTHTHLPSYRSTHTHSLSTLQHITLDVTLDITHHT